MHRNCRHAKRRKKVARLTRGMETKMTDKIRILANICKGLSIASIWVSSAIVCFNVPMDPVIFLFATVATLLVIVFWEGITSRQ